MAGQLRTAMAAQTASPPASPDVRFAPSLRHKPSPLSGGRFRENASSSSPTLGSPKMASSSAPSRTRRQRRNDTDEPFENLIATLSRQKEELRLVQTSTMKPVKSPSAPRLGGDYEVVSTMHGSASYSFGKPTHQKGRFGIQVLGPRDMDYAIPGEIVVPGPGTYSLPHTDGKDLSPTEGHTGGWPSRQHSLFVKTFRDYEEIASPEFFDRLMFLMPELPRKAFTDHLRWMADFDHTGAKKRRTMLRFVDENKTAEMPPEDKREQWIDWKRAMDFRQQADEEDSRSGLKDRVVTILPHQRGLGGEVLDSNFRGHPEFRKAPGYTFGQSREIRDVRDQRHSGLSQVRSSSALDTPGPGAYLGLAEKAPLLEKLPSWTMRMKMPAQKVDRPSSAGPGYDGPLHAGERVQNELRFLRHSQPTWTMGKEAPRSEHLSNERKALRDMFSTEEHVGPGRYKHPTALHTKHVV
mmetsp:Transcript_81128/g.211503  ORF Transcript_81128/g.211503 Transcript_81128/m.211503 type:complete len:466 (-) Transcript_81128:103-1500(-)